MKPGLLGMLVVGGLLLASASVPAQDQKAALVQQVATARTGLSAMVVDKLMTFQLSPGWWARLGDESGIQNGTRDLNFFAQTLLQVAVNLKLGDAKALDKTSGNNPGADVAAMIDSWKSKLSCKLVMDFPTNPATDKAVLDNLALVPGAFSDAYYCLPRGGQFHLVVTVDPKATAMRCLVSKDGNDYAVTIPATQSFNQSALQQQVAKGK